MEEDRISKLPDCLLVEILSRLPQTIYAVRTSSLSKRWRHVWHQVPNLVFRHPYDTDASSEFYSFVDKTITQRPQLKLKKFEVSCGYYDPPFDSQLRNWLHYAISCNVEDLDFPLWNICQPLSPLAQLFFMNSCFTNLALVGCMFNHTGAISWKNLRSLYITYGKLDDDAIENILSGSPVLETLVLDRCNGYRRVNITSKSVKNLVFSRYIGDDVEINAPNILSLLITRKMNFSRLLLLDVSSLVIAELDYRNYGRMISEKELLKGFILSLRHVKDLILGPYCFDAFAQLILEGFESPSNLKVHDRFADMLQKQIDAYAKSRRKDDEQYYAITSSGLEDDDEEIDDDEN